MPQPASKDCIWHFGVYQVDGRRAELRRGGSVVRLREQCFRILIYLVEHAGELVTREDLRRVLWPGDTYVDFEHSLNAAMMKLRDALGDVADSPIYIETVPRRGYRFIAPVTQAVEEARAKTVADPRADGLPPAAATSEALAHGSNGSPGQASNGTSKGRAEQGFWIAVFPFKWSGAGAQLASCADGATEDIVTGLSRFSYLRVVAASAMARYAGRPADLLVANSEVGKEVGARYLLEGSLRQAGQRMRVAAQLADCETGANLWAETYDRDFRSGEEFELLDDVVPQIVSTIADLHGVLPRSMADSLRDADVASLGPYEAVLRCFAYFQSLDAEEHHPVRAALERAVAQAPGYADAWAMLSLVCKEEFAHGLSRLPEAVGDPLERALAAARRAVEIAPSNHLAHHALAAAEFFRKEYQRFRLAAARALELNPMDGFTLAYLGLLIAYSGDWKRGGVLCASARRLNPHHPGWYWFVPGMDAYRNGDFRAAIEFAERANMPRFWRTSLLLAAAHGQLGNRSQAAAALKTLLEQRPDMAQTPRDTLSVWWQPEMVAKLMQGLESAGPGELGA